MIFSNFHTHTYFCDGKDSPEELVDRALALGCPAIGFSGHGYTEYDTSYCMSLENERKYKEEILRLKDRYKGKIKILLGIEKDFYSARQYPEYDYIIGGVHYIEKDGIYYDVDESPQKQLLTVENAFGGNIWAYIDAYYKNMGLLYEHTGCDIVAHFDLITKFNERSSIFDTADPRYKNAADRALASLCSHPLMFEINTGAISRGYRSFPYPERTIIEKIKANGKGLLLSSDCHEKKHLLYAFDKFEYLL